MVTEDPSQILKCLTTQTSFRNVHRGQWIMAVAEILAVISFITKLKKRKRVRLSDNGYSSSCGGEQADPLPSVYKLVKQ